MSLTALALDLKPGDDIDTQRLAETLVDAGFTHQDPVDEHGEFCIRGGVIDIFPAGDDLPARIELIGDTIEAIRRYEPDTQRSVVTIERLRVVPLREVVGSGFGTRSAESFSRQTQVPKPVLWRMRRACRSSTTSASRAGPSIVVSEPDEIRERIEKQLAQISESYEQATAGRSRGGASPKPAGVPGEGGAGTETWAPKPSDILISWPDIERQLAGASVLEELGLDDAGRRPGAPKSHEPRESTRSGRVPESGAAGRVPSAESRAPSPGSQPALSFSGRLTEWIDEVKAARARRRHRGVRRRHAGPRRAPHRSARRLRTARRATSTAARTRSRASVLVTTGVLSRGFRLPAAQLQIFAETDLFEEERRAQERARRSAAAAFLSDLRDLKVGDLVVHVDNGIGEFVGLKRDDRRAERDARVPRAALRGRRQAVRARVAPRPDPEVHAAARGRRSTGSAARRGRRPRRASRRPCATWPRSCSSSTPRARPWRATPSRPTRTGRRSSRARSRST